MVTPTVMTLNSRDGGFTTPYAPARTWACRVSLALTLASSPGWSQPRRPPRRPPPPATATAPSNAPTVAQLNPAQQAFDEGVQLTEQNRWREALERFRGACEANPSALCLRWQVVTLHRLGNYADAARTLARYDAVRSNAPHPAIEEIRPDILAHVARVRLVPDGVVPSGVTFAVDGRELTSAQLDDRVILEPGAHLVESRGPGRDPAREVIDVAGGQDRSISVRVASERVPVTRRWWFWTLIGTAVVGTTAAILWATSGLGDGPPIENQLGTTVETLRWGR